jgi:hypothetical protein
MVAKIVGTLLFIAIGALASGMLFGPGDVAKQLMVVVIWFGVGFAVCKLWN